MLASVFWWCSSSTILSDTFAVSVNEGEGKSLYVSVRFSPGTSSVNWTGVAVSNWSPLASSGRSGSR